MSRCRPEPEPAAAASRACMCTRQSAASERVGKFVLKIRPTLLDSRSRNRDSGWPNFGFPNSKGSCVHIHASHVPSLTHAHAFVSVHTGATFRKGTSVVVARRRPSLSLGVVTRERLVHSLSCGDCFPGGAKCASATCITTAATRRELTACHAAAAHLPGQELPALRSALRLSMYRPT